MSEDGKEFPDAAWQFHLIPEEERAAAWRWEFEIEHGSGVPHWLDLDDQRRGNVREFSTKIEPVKEGSFSGGEADLQRDMDGTGWNIHLLQIQWTEGKTAVKEALSRWVDSDPANVFCIPGLVRPSKGGRQKQYYAWLVDLAVCRADGAGIKRSEGLVKLASLLETSPKYWKRDETWSAAVRTTEERLRKAEDWAKFHHLARNVAGSPPPPPYDGPMVTIRATRSVWAKVGRERETKALKIGEIVEVPEPVARILLGGGSAEIAET